ncbi:MAG: glycerophosphodiester phosphodiesterase [Rhodocyclales bacterium]|nr:glycerophosphodiester phosphodiesterase [Rhodocyclales bacterium]
MQYPRIIAHRCGGGLAPENTLAGLRIAARLGCRGVEFDAMLSADDVPLLIHDELLERTTSGRGPVAATRAADMTRLDAGSYHHRAFAGEPAPTLQQALAVCGELGLWANVEIKPSAGREGETGRIVARLAADFGEVLLSSFSRDALREAAIAAERLPRALLVDSAADDWLRSVGDTGADALHMAVELATPERVHALNVAGIPVACYTVNRRETAAQMFAMGVCAVFTDRPDLWAVDEM